MSNEYLPTLRSDRGVWVPKDIHRWSWSQAGSKEPLPRSQSCGNDKTMNCDTQDEFQMEEPNVTYSTYRGSLRRFGGGQTSCPTAA